MKKVTIIGRGTAGSLGALHLNNHLNKDEFEVEWLFDNSIPTRSVGEGSTIALPNTLYESTGFTYSDLPKIGGTIKTGLRKSGWGKGDDFNFDFRGGVAYHFQASMLQQYTLDFLKERVSINDTYVGDVGDIDSDFVFDCRGTPKELDERFVVSDNITLNTAKIWQCPWDAPRFDYTLTLARPYGWVFGIPLSNRLSIGYLYNRDYATLEMIEEDIKVIFKEYDIEPGEDGNYIEFNSYYRKENFDGRVGYSGNASFFLEPLEATSTAVMDTCQRQMFDMIKGNLPKEVLNTRYTSFLEQTENMLLFHYFAGSKWDTEFWKFAKEKGEKKLLEAKNDSELMNRLSDSVKMAESKEFMIIPSKLSYSTWDNYAFALHLKKFGIIDKIKDLISI